MMRAKFVLALAALLLVATFGHGLRAQEPSAAGLWQSVDDDTHQPTGWFLIHESGGFYVGSLVKMFLKPGEDPNVVCSRCKDDRHDKPWQGLEIIRGMKRDGLKYEDGTILDPRDGNIYNAKMTLSPDSHSLIVRGYLGFSLLGRNQYWTRLPDSAFNEIDPALNPNPKPPVVATPHRSGAAPKQQNSVQH